MRLSQQNITPTATKQTNFGADILETSAAQTNATLAPGSSLLLTTLTKVNPSDTVFTVPEISIFQDSITPLNQIPNGSNINPSDYQIIGPWNDLSQSDGKNVAFNIYIGNTTSPSGSYTQQINASANDGYKLSSPSSWGYADTTLIVGASASSSYDPAWRFTNVTITQGATITSATLSVIFKTTDFTPPDTYKKNIYGIAEDNTADFSTDPTSRAKTSANAAWNITVNAVETTITSPDLSSIIQEIVNRSGWVSGNALGFLTTDNGTTSNHNGAIYSYDGTPAKAATLTINYGGGVNKNVIILAQGRGIVANPNLVT